MVDLHDGHGMWPSFAMAAMGFLLSAGLLALAGWGAKDRSDDGLDGSAATGTGSLAAFRAVASVPALRWLAAVTVALALGFYAQFESGLPAFALMFLDVPERTIGTAAAVNCLVIVALQKVVVRWTVRRHSASLLVAVGLVWLLSWTILAFSMRTPGIGAVLFVTTYGIFAVGETLFAPVLSPLTASLAPGGMVGTTLGLFAALQTGVSAVGPLLAGFALGAGHGMTFVVVHLVISVVAVLAALRLRRVLPPPARLVATTSRSSGARQAPVKGVPVRPALPWVWPVHRQEMAKVIDADPCRQQGHDVRRFDR